MRWNCAILCSNCSPPWNYGCKFRWNWNLNSCQYISRILGTLLHVSWKRIFNSSLCSAPRYSYIFSWLVEMEHSFGQFCSCSWHQRKALWCFFAIFRAPFQSKELWGLTGAWPHDGVVIPHPEASSEVQKLSICVIFRCSCSYENLTSIQLWRPDSGLKVWERPAEDTVAKYNHIFIERRGLRAAVESKMENYALCIFGTVYTIFWLWFLCNRHVHKEQPFCPAHD